MCEYHIGAPRNKQEQWEIIVGALLTQNTQWYPNTVRAIQQLKLGRPFTKNELEVIKEAEIIHEKISRNPKLITKNDILTQNTSWLQVEKALLNLKELKALDPKNIIKLKTEILKDAIKPAGYFNQKAERLKLLAKWFLKIKETPSRQELLSLKGIGAETADAILLYAFKIPEFVIDAYTKRILIDLKLVNKNAKYNEMKEIFENDLPKDYKLYQEFHALLVEYAKRNFSGRKQQKINHTES